MAEEKSNFLSIPIDIIKDRKLVSTLAKNDFRSRFAGSYFGIVWAFVQPIITVLVYWFVFEKALHAGGNTTREGITVPFVLWLVAGLIPWFYFQEVVVMGTNALLEYSYLVKKVVFNITTLPVVKAVSSLFVHLFFVAFMFVLYFAYHFPPSLYNLQVIYYSFCMLMLVLGIIYATSAAVVFFRDLSQIVNIIMQVWIWVTPIMWNIDAMTLSPWVIKFLKLNPLYYIVAGYRDAMFNQVWFWDKPRMTLYFWGITLIIFILGTTIFSKLKAHFADVL